MPRIKINHVVSFSSEDPAHCADNLLSSDLSKKWKCLNPGEKSASVVLQLEKACVISSIDIGNEHSAYVEVLASRSSSNDDYKILLVMSSFMTPLESKQSHNINKVRMFTKDQLQDPERNEKWDRIKIICTQPFNRHVQYGLSFITLNTPEENESGLGNTRIGKFLLRPNSPDNINAGSLFAKKKELGKEQPLTGAAAIRQASNMAFNGTPPVNQKLIETPLTPKNKPSALNSSDSESTPKERNRDEILYNQDDEGPNKKIDELIERKNKEAEEKKQQDENNKKQSKIKDIKDAKKGASTVKEKEKKRTKEDHLDSPSTSTQTIQETKRKADNGFNMTPNKRIKQNVKKKPFYKLLEGVVLVISGIQQPERGKIRAQAIQMGSKYKPDWDVTCTHLVCAFPNTPKFNQVRGKGKIVMKNWIYDCHRERKRFPWRRYALDKKDTNESESEEEIWEQKELGGSEDDSAEEMHSGDGSDTEDEIERIQAQQQKKQTKKKKENTPEIVKTTEVDPFSADTEDEDDVMTRKVENVNYELPKFFEHHVLYIDKHLPKDDIKRIEKYIHAYKGVLVEDPSDIVDIILTERNKDNSDLEEACPEAKIVDYNWIWECHNQQKIVSLDNFTIHS